MNTALCDLILLTCGNLKDLKPCVESLFETTRIPSRLILVDNDSPQETKAFLRSIKANDAIGSVEVLTNEKNEGFGGGMNRGMRQATAPYVALLNDDLIFTKEWLARIVEAGERFSQIGILNPSSNTLGDHPPKGGTLEQYAQERRGRFLGKISRMATASGFCMVIKREVIQKIGHFDEAFSPAFFEDTDYSCRAAQAGYQVAMVKDAYVYHHEHRSFFRIRGQSEFYYKRNEAVFTKKWGRSLRILAPLSFTRGADPEAFRQNIETLSEWAFQRCSLYVPLRISGPDFQEMNKALSLRDRCNVQFFPFGSDFFFNAYCLYRFLKRRKKPVHCLFFFDSAQGRFLLRRAAALSGLPVFAADGSRLVMLNGRQAEAASRNLQELPVLMREALVG